MKKKSSIRQITAKSKKASKAISLWKLTKLNSFLGKHFSEDNYDINHGGCGYFALVLYDKLKLLGLEPTIIVKDRAPAAFSYLRNNMGKLSPDEIAITFNHVFIKIEDKYIDCTGVWSLEQFEFMWGESEIWHEISKDELNICVKYGQTWNSIYDPSIYNKKIKTIINSLKL